MVKWGVSGLAVCSCDDRSFQPFAKLACDEAPVALEKYEQEFMDLAAVVCTYLALNGLGGRGRYGRAILARLRWALRVFELLQSVCARVIARPRPHVGPVS